MRLTHFVYFLTTSLRESVKPVGNPANDLPLWPYPAGGNHGCLDAYAGEYAIINDCRMEMKCGRANILQEICKNPEEPQISEILEAQEEK